MTCKYCEGSGKIMRAVQGCGHSEGSVTFVPCPYCKGGETHSSTNELEG